MPRGDTTEIVRTLASERGVSESTAWRWLAQMHAEQSDELLGQKWKSCSCLACGAELPPEATFRRRYCDGTCRLRHHRRRKAAERRAKRRPVG
jgi:hypothetical protein